MPAAELFTHRPGEGQASRWGRGLAFALIGALAVYYYFAIWSLSINLPWFDDYVQFLGTYVRLGQDYSPQDLFAILFEQPHWHDKIKSDHRLGFARMTMVATRALFDQVDFKYLIMIGNAFVGLWFLALWSLSPLARRQPLVMLPIALLVFSLAHREASFWASAALLYYPTTFFALLAIAFALRKPSGLPVSIGSGVLAALAQANGLLSLPTVAAALAFAGRRRAALIMVLVTVAAFVLYFHDFARPASIPSYASTWHAVRGIFLGWLQLQGNAVPGQTLPIGAMATAVWVYLAWRGHWKSHPVLFWFGVWMLASMATVALGRASISDEYVATQNRYRFYSISFLAVTYLIVMEVMANRLARRLLLLVMLVLAAQTYIRETPSGWAYSKSTMIDGALAANHYRLEGRAPEATLWFPKVHDVKEIIGYAEANRLYFMPFSKKYLAHAMPAPTPGPLAPLNLAIAKVLTGQRSLAVTGNAEIGAERGCGDTRTLVFLESGPSRYYFKSVRYTRPDTMEFFGKPCQAFAAFIETANLPAGEYRLGVAITENGRAVAEGLHGERIDVNRVH